MSEIEKIYELAVVNKKCIDKRYEKCTGVCYDCKYFIYPPFTAEKQLELLCFLINFGVKITMQKCSIPIKTENIANNLAGITNDIWQDLTEEEKQQIKEILE